MNKKRLVVIVSMLVIIIGLIVGICHMLTPVEKEVTEEEYNAHPKYMLADALVSEGKHFELPKVKKVWRYDCGRKECYVRGIVELSKSNYNKVISQLENELKIPRVENSEFKDDYERISCSTSYAVDDTVYEGKAVSEIVTGEIVQIHEDVDITYVIKSEDCKYQTARKGQMLLAIFMVEKDGRYYMAIRRTTDYDMFYPERND